MRRPSPLECAASAQTRYSLQLDPAWLKRAARTLAQLAVKVDGTAEQLHEALLMLGYPEQALRSRLSASTAKASPQPRDSIGRVRHATSGVVQDRCRSGKHLMIGANVGHKSPPETGRYCKACRSGNKRAKRFECKNGHSMTGDNLRIIANGARRCRICITSSKGAYKRGAA